MKILRLSGDCLNSHSLKPCQSPVMSWTFPQSITLVNVFLSNGVKTVQYFSAWGCDVTLHRLWHLVYSCLCNNFFFVNIHWCHIYRCNLIIATSAGNWTIFMDKCFLTNSVQLLIITALALNFIVLKEEQNLQFLNHWLLSLVL